MLGQVSSSKFSLSSFSRRVWRRDSPVCTHTKFSLVRLVEKLARQLSYKWDLTSENLTSGHVHTGKFSLTRKTCPWIRSFSPSWNARQIHVPRVWRHSGPLVWVTSGSVLFSLIFSTLWFVTIHHICHCPSCFINCGLRLKLLIFSSFNGLLCHWWSILWKSVG